MFVEDYLPAVEVQHFATSILFNQLDKFVDFEGHLLVQCIPVNRVICIRVSQPQEDQNELVERTHVPCYQSQCRVGS